MENELMRIGEIAAFFDISVKAVRLYEKKGIIKPAKVDDETGYRYYTVTQVQQLNALIELKSLGFSLDEIHKILDGKISADMMDSVLEKKKQAWQKTIQNAENKIDAIEGITSRLQTSKDAGKIIDMTPEERAWLLVRMVCVEDLRAQSMLSEALWL